MKIVNTYAFLLALALVVGACAKGDSSSSASSDESDAEISAVVVTQ
jgi:hypothetical protein